MERIVTCIECPKGCQVKVTFEKDKIIEVVGNGCIKGKQYAENEIICPRRVLTSTVKNIYGQVVAVKTDKPIKKSYIFDVMKIINSYTLDKHVIIGDIVIENIIEDINLIATDNK